MKATLQRLARSGLAIATLTLTGVLLSKADEPVDAPPPQAPQVAAPIAIPQSFTPGIEEIVKLARAGVGEEVLAAFIRRSETNYQPTADEIVLLTDLGVSKQVIAMLLQPAGQRDLQTAVVQLPQATVPVVASTPAPATVEAPPIQTNVIVTQPVVVENNPVTLVELPQQETRVVRYFWPSLEPFGAWVQLGSYGWCWRPTVAVSNPAWRPYASHGRWIYSDCGWYWLSDYSWGWATFHYGRWFLDSSQGWCWAPDSVWSPAWVSWRTSGDYCGWAPLPPLGRHLSSSGYATITAHDFGIHASLYTYLPVANLCDDSPIRFGLTGSRFEYAHARSASQNRFQRLSGGIGNAGFSPQHYEGATRRSITPVALRASEGDSRPDQITRHGNASVVYRAQLDQLPLKPSPRERDFDREEPKAALASTRSSPGNHTSTRNYQQAAQTESRPAHSANPITRAGNDSPVQSDFTTRAGVPIYSGHQGSFGDRSRREGPASRTEAHRVNSSSPSTSTTPLSPPQPVTSVPQPLGVDPRPPSPPRPITSVPQVPGVDARPFTPPQPITANPGAYDDGTRRVREPGRYEPSRNTAEMPNWEKTARGRYEVTKDQPAWERNATQQLQQQTSPGSSHRTAFDARQRPSETPSWEKTARGRFETSREQPSWQRAASEQLRQQQVQPAPTPNRQSQPAPSPSRIQTQPQRQSDGGSDNRRRR